MFSDQPALDEPWRPDLGTRCWARLRNTAKVTAPIRLGDLRHASPTWLLSRGIDARTIAERLGHTRTATTTDTYAHVIPATDRAAAAILGELLG